MKILLPLDGSDVSLGAVRFAIRLIREGLNASLVLANVQEPASLYEMVVAPDAQVLENVSVAAGTHALQSGEELLKLAGMAYECEVASGDPAHTIVDIVERLGCDLVIMGASGMGPLRSALLGSVSHEVLHAAGVPVMIIKAQEEPDLDATE
jgi:nucleotide-binding universal stress UspA family protein